MAKDNQFYFEFSKFYSGLSPAAHLNDLTSVGGSGHSSDMVNCDVLNPDYLQQGPELSALTGTPGELINFIMDKAVADDVTYGIGATKLFSLSSTAVSALHTISACADGESCLNLKGVLYYPFNTSSEGRIGSYDLASTYNDSWASGLEKAPHPIASKEDIFVMGNGRYLSVYTKETDTFEPEKLDFGTGYEVSDVVFHGNQWWIAVNSGIAGDNRTVGEIYVYDGSATETILADEASVGVQRIGFLYVLSGMIYVAYQDLSSNTFNIGYIYGRQIKRLASFKGTLPTFAQKTLFKNTILFLSDSKVFSCGAVIDDLPIQISQLATGGTGAVAAPFGTPLISTASGVYKFSGYEVTSSWRSIVIPLMSGSNLGTIDEVVVLTNTLGDGARADLQLEYDQDTADSGTAQQITGAKRRHILKNFGGPHEDFRIFIDFANGSAVNPVQIRKIFVTGHYFEK
jgi:hypothetical protein